jgi:hypothetical protein
VSAIGDFLREIMPSWLNRPGRDHLDTRRRGLRPSARHQAGEDDPRELAREADAVWKQCVDDGQHGEAFPEPIPGKRGRAEPGPGTTESKREKPAGSSGLH